MEILTMIMRRSGSRVSRARESHMTDLQTSNNQAN